MLQINSNVTKYYRYEDFLVHAWDYEYETITHSRVVVNLKEFNIIKHTPCGVWLDVFGTKKFVKTKARKRWACPTKKETYKSFLARKKKQKRILERQLSRVEQSIHLITIMEKDNDKS